MSTLAKKIVTTPPLPQNTHEEEIFLWLIENFARIKSILSSGVNGTFTSNDAPNKVITVENGIITNIV